MTTPEEIEALNAEMRPPSCRPAVGRTIRNGAEVSQFFTSVLSLCGFGAQVTHYQLPLAAPPDDMDELLQSLEGPEGCELSIVVGTRVNLADVFRDNLGGIRVLDGFVCDVCRPFERDLLFLRPAEQSCFGSRILWLFWRQIVT